MLLRFSRKLFVSIAFLTCIFSVVKSQKLSAKPAGYLEKKQISKVLTREISYRVILPDIYQKFPKKKFPVMYLLHGRFGHFNDWTDFTDIEDYARGFDFVVIMPEGGAQSWYTNSVKNPQDKYETYFFDELMPEVQKNFRVINAPEGNVIAGLSMGGFGAFKYAMKRPFAFLLAGSFSGALDGNQRLKGNPMWSQSIDDAFGAPDSEERKSNDLFSMLQQMPAEKGAPFLYFVCGTEDSQITSNEKFAVIAASLHVPHEYRQRPGKHDWEFWDAAIKEFLPIAAARVTSANIKASSK